MQIVFSYKLIGCIYLNSRHKTRIKIVMLRATAMVKRRHREFLPPTIDIIDTLYDGFTALGQNNKF